MGTTPVYAVQAADPACNDREAAAVMYRRPDGGFDVLDVAVGPEEVRALVERWEGRARRLTGDAP